MKFLSTNLKTPVVASFMLICSEHAEQASSRGVFEGGGGGGGGATGSLNKGGGEQQASCGISTGTDYTHGNGHQLHKPLLQYTHLLVM